LTRSRSTKSALTSSTNPNIERQAKRLSRQQKQLDRDIQADLSMNVPTKLVGAKGRTIKLSDLINLTPLTDTQQYFFDAYNDGEEAFTLFGSAGTGKSFIALYHALRDVLHQDSVYDKIIIVRSTAQSRNMGFLPGDMNEKTEPFEAPYIEICHTLLNRSDAYEKLKDMGKIEFVSTSFLRGTTFNNSIIIFDEAQNETFQGLSTVLTRVGKDTKIIVCGDGAQNDLIHSKTDVSGFRDFIGITNSMNEFNNFKFTVDDIVRSGFVKAWLVACEHYGI
jgi:predicted ribonuclease YlaK